MSTPDRWTATVASLAGEPAPALPAGRGRRHRLRDSDHDPAAALHDAVAPYTDRKPTMPNLTNEQRFLGAAGDLLSDVLQRLHRTSPDAVTATAAVLNSGGMVRLQATLAPRTRTGWLECTLLTARGEEIPLGQVELKHRDAAAPAPATPQ
jgi:hypothetical protein